MVWFGAIAIGVVISITDILLLSNNKKTGRVILTVIRDTLFSVLSGMVLTQRYLDVKNIFEISSQRISYSWKFLGFVLFAGVMFIILSGFIQRIFKFEFNEDKPKKAVTVLKYVATVLFALGVAAYTGTNWGKEAFGDLAPDQILINLNSPTEGTDAGVYISLFSGPVLTTVFLTLIFCIVIFPDYRIAYEKGNKKTLLFPSIFIKIVSFILALAIFICGCGYGINKFQLATLYDAYLTESTYIEEHYVDPKTTDIKFPEEKRNLIFIYLESMENTFFSKELGGYFGENYMPDLAELSKEGISFSHKAEGFGGALQTTGSGWSVAAMVNMEFGIPMKTPAKPNSYGALDNFLPGGTALGDILKAEGYEQSLMFGADATFGGVNFFFQSHGDYNILDHKGVIEKGWLPEYYDVWWGYEDDKLYEFAKKELTRLGDSDKPFHFIMETADTHAPDGYLSEKADKKYASQYANCIYYSQAQAVEFVRWIQEQDFYENTTIVIVGDHLSMANSFFEGMEGYRRTIFNLFLNVPEELQNIPEEYKFNRKWAPFDIFPTTLACLGVDFEGPRLAMGTNLFSGEKTLIETDGFEKVNEELENLSVFYNENILSNPDDTEEQE